MAPPEGSYAARRIRSDLFDSLELNFGERVIGACDTDALRLGILESPASDRVILVDTTGDVIDSFEWFYDALEAVGRMLDAHFDSVPTDVAGEPVSHSHDPTSKVPRSRLQDGGGGPVCGRTVQSSRTVDRHWCRLA